MKNSIKIMFLFLTINLVLSSCGDNKYDQRISEVTYKCPMECEGDKVYVKKESCPVCKMDLKEVNAEEMKILNEDEISGASIFNLTSKWKTQNDETIEWRDLKGDVLVVVMIYTACKAACPRLVADMRAIHQKVNSEKVKYILVSIDPENDTPKRLKEFAIENQMDNNQWVFLQGSIDDVREFSNVLAVKYKQISPLDFSHSNIISVFDAGGVLVHQQEGLGVDNKETVSEIIQLVK